MTEFIAEWGPPRDLAIATRQAEAASSIGAAWSKWQMFEPNRLASRDAKRYWDPALGGSESQLETFKDADALGHDEWMMLAEACKDLDIGFLVTPFDLEAVELLEDIGVSAYKIASGDITYRPLYEKVARTGKRVFFSTGAASVGEVRSARSWLKRSPATAMACDLVYPCEAPASDMRKQLWQLAGMTETVGYSDHTREIATGAVAVALGARVLEKHLTLDPNGDAPDDKMALSPEQARQYLRLAEEAEELCGTPAEDEQADARVGARRSAYAARSIAPGEVLKAKDILWLRPAGPGSISPIHKLAGRMLSHSVDKNKPITRDLLI